MNVTSDYENTSIDMESTDANTSHDESFFQPSRKKKTAIIISDTSSDDESADVPVSSYKNIADTSGDEKVTSNVTTDSYAKIDETPSEDENETSNVPKNSYEKVNETSSEDENETSNVPTNSYEKVNVTHSEDENETSHVPTSSYEKIDDNLSENDEVFYVPTNSNEKVGQTNNMLSPELIRTRANNSDLMTPRAVKAIVDSDSESEVEIIEGSSDEENFIPYIPSARKKQISPTTLEDEFTPVDEYLNLKRKIESLESDLQKSKTTLRTVSLSALPDKGEMLAARYKSLEAAYHTAKAEFSKMKIKEELTAGVKPVLTWDDLQTASTTVQPKTFGKQAMATYNAQKALTMDRLHQLHGSIKTCPTEDTLETDPRGLKVDLMDHQKHALAWMIWRENQKPSGGILADDMGLGKTLTIISLILKQRELQSGDNSSDEENTPQNRRHKYNGGSLIVCPASVMKQWEEEVQKHCKKYLLTVEPYHGPKRESRSKRLAMYDMVITTYAICQSEFEKATPINSIYWQRIILDEGHQIKNFKCTTSKAVCEFSAKSRWVLTGTPVHNKELDMYSLLKFLRCSPFDDIAVWKRWVSDKSHGGQERLHTVLSSLMLRRTKQQLQERGTLTCLPDRQWELIQINLKKCETDIYQKILIFSRTLFAQFLHQRAEKDTDFRDKNELFDYANIYKGNAEYHKMHKMLLKLNKVKVIKQHDILLLLLRLRQICCHPSLITGMLHGEDNAELGGDDEHQEEINILEQLNKLNMDDNFDDTFHNQSHDENNLAENCRTLLNPSNPVFHQQYKSSKIEALVKKIKECVLQREDKAVVVSQFSSFLKIIADHLKQEHLHFEQLDGSVPVYKRKDMVANFNNQRHPTKILLLSLTAGGVGLNLIGGNHLFLMDLHWNPQLEMQAQDRIYRVGQKKSVYVYKFITTETIEERIKKLQDRKLDIANSMLTGAKLQQSKLSLEDLKMLFNM